MPDLRLASAAEDCRQTKLIQPGGTVLYEVQTDNSTTTIRRLTTSVFHPNGQTIGSIQWHSIPSTLNDSISVASGPYRKVTEVLRRPDVSSLSAGTAANFFGLTNADCFVFTGRTGGEYRWTIHHDTLKLCPEGSSKPIAVYHMERARRLRKSEPPYLDVTEEGTQILDDIVVMWVWVGWRKMTEIYDRSRKAIYQNPALV